MSLHDYEKDVLTRLYSSIFKGNEIEFVYNRKRYYILPLYSKEKTIEGICFGEAYTENETIVYSESDFCNVQIGNSKFVEVISDIDIVWKNIDF